MTRVTVLLPVSTDAQGLPTAAADILNQTHSNLTLLILLNGADAPTRTAAEALRTADPRVHIEVLPNAGLTAALNHGLHASQTEFLARMDSDDRCEPTRLEVQLAAMQADTGPDALGCAWRMQDQSGTCRAIMRPPQSVLAAWWQLFTHNVFAHGSMMFRRSRVLDAGGYDPTLERAQDYDLWLRLATQGGVRAIADTLYTHTIRPSTGFHSSPLQATCAARALLTARSRLSATSEAAASVAAALTSTPTADGASALITQLESEPPTIAGLSIRTQLLAHIPHPSPTTTDPAGVMQRLIELRGVGVTRAWLWGAGANAERISPLLDQVGIALVGIVDDSVAGTTRLGFRVQSPAALTPNDHAIISSEAHEAAIWRSAATHLARGVRIHRLSTAGTQPTTPTS